MSLIALLQYQLAVFQALLIEMDSHLSCEPTLDEAEDLFARIQKERTRKNELVSRARLLATMPDKPVVSMN